MSNKRYVKLYADYKRTFETDFGRRVLFDLMRTHYVMGSTFDLNPSEMCLREGERNVILRILHNLGVDTAQMLKHLNEAQKKEEEFND